MFAFLSADQRQKHFIYGSPKSGALEVSRCVEAWLPEQCESQVFVQGLRSYLVVHFLKHAEIVATAIWKKARTETKCLG